MPVIKPVRGIQIAKSHPLARGLAGYWLFNEGSGGKVFDSSGGNAGSLIADTYWVPGKFGFALAFDGAGDYVNITRHPSITLNTPWSIQIVGKYEGGANLQSMFQIGDGSNTIAVVYWDGTGNYGEYGLLTQRRNLGDSEQLSAPSPSIQSIMTDWNVYHFVFDGGENNRIQIYVNGVSRYTTGTQTLASVTNDRIAISRAAVGYDSVSQIDHFVIWNRALSASEIALLYREPFCMFEQALNIARISSVVVNGFVEIEGSLAALSFLTDSADLRRVRGIAGGVTAQSSLAGSIKVSRKISGTISATSSLVGSLSLVGEVSRSRGSGFKPIEGAERLRGLRRSAFY